MRVLKDNIHTFSVVGSSDKLFHIEIRALKAGMCKNGWDFTEEGIEKCKNTFLGMAILCAYKFSKIGDGHNFDVSLNPESREPERDFRGADCERIVGYIPENSNIHYEMQDGEKWLVIPAVLFRFYNIQLVNDIIEKGHKNVSIEVDTPDEFIEKLEGGKERIHGFDALGVTILGDNVEPAVTGAKLKALSQSKEFRALSLKAASYIDGKNNKEGVGAKMFNKTEVLKKLAADFPDYHVLNVTDDGLAVILLKDGILEVRSLEKKVDCSVVPVLKAFATLETREENEDGKTEKACEFEINELLTLCTRSFTEQIATLTKKLSDSEETTKNLQMEVDTMKGAEEKRKKAEIVAALSAEREKENSDHPDTKVLEADYNIILKRAENGEYADVKSCLADFALEKMKRINTYKQAQNNDNTRINYGGISNESGSQGFNPQTIFDNLPDYSN